MGAPRAHLLECALLVGLSLLAHRVLFRDYQPAPTADLTYPISAALNAVSGQGLVTIDPRLRLPDDLGMVHETLLTTWPPGMTLVYLALVSIGLRVFDVSALIAVGSIVTGTLGWCAFFARLGAGRLFLRAFSVLSAFLPFGCFALRWLKTDYVIWAIAPWSYIAVMAIFTTARPRYVRLAIAALATASLFLVKYSAIAILFGSSVYALHRAIRERRLSLALPLIAAGLVTCCAVFILNRNLTGQTSAIFSWGIKWCGFRPREIAAMLALPMEQLSGWGRVLDATGMDGFWSGTALGLLGALMAFTSGRKLAVTERSKESLELLEIQTLCLYGVFLALSFWFGYCFEWSAESAEQQFRYFAPVMYGWVYVPLIVAESQRRRPLRLLCAAFFGLPIAANIVAEASLPLRVPAPTYLPVTGLSWGNSPSDLRFVRETMEKHGKPDLLIAPSPELMPELRVPTLVYRKFWSFRRFETSRALYAWIFLEDSAQPGLAKAFVDWDIHRVETPPGFPYELWLARSNAAQATPSAIPDAITR